MFFAKFSKFNCCTSNFFRKISIKMYIKSIYQHIHFFYHYREIYIFIHILDVISNLIPLFKL